MNNTDPRKAIFPEYTEGRVYPRVTLNLPLVPSGSGQCITFCARVFCPLIPTSPIVTYMLSSVPTMIFPPLPIAPGVAERFNKSFGFINLFCISSYRYNRLPIGFFDKVASSPSSAVDSV